MEKKEGRKGEKEERRENIKERNSVLFRKNIEW